MKQDTKMILLFTGVISFMMFGAFIMLHQGVPDKQCSNDIQNYLNNTLVTQDHFTAEQAMKLCKNSYDMLNTLQYFPFIGILLILGLIRTIKRWAIEARQVLLKQNDKCFRCNATITEETVCIGSNDPHGYCSRCAFILNDLDKQKERKK